MKIKLNNNDINAVSDYLKDNFDKPIYQVYNDIKSKKMRERTKTEHLVFTYLSLNKRKLGIK